MQPVRNNILFKPFYSENISLGGIIIPDNCKEPSNKGKVIAVGKGTKKIPMKLQPGEIVYKVKGSGTEIMINDELHFLVEDNAILAKE